ncbi:unnamed protein product [Diplocarpon coronariae]
MYTYLHIHTHPHLFLPPGPLSRGKSHPNTPPGVLVLAASQYDEDDCLHRDFAPGKTGSGRARTRSRGPAEMVSIHGSWRFRAQIQCLAMARRRRGAADQHWVDPDPPPARHLTSACSDTSGYRLPTRSGGEDSMGRQRRPVLSPWCWGGAQDPDPS